MLYKLSLGITVLARLRGETSLAKPEKLPVKCIGPGVRQAMVS